MHQAGPTCSSRAWTRDTDGSPAITRSLSGLLPIDSAPASLVEHHQVVSCRSEPLERRHVPLPGADRTHAAASPLPSDSSAPPAAASWGAPPCRPHGVRIVGT